MPNDSLDSKLVAFAQRVGEEIRTIQAASDVVDVVADYTALTNYNIASLTDKDVVKVLDYSGTQNGTTYSHDQAYFRWNMTTKNPKAGTWEFVGVVTSLSTASDSKIGGIKLGTNTASTTTSRLTGKQNKYVPLGVNVFVESKDGTLGTLNDSNFAETFPALVWDSAPATTDENGDVVTSSGDEPYTCLATTIYGAYYTFIAEALTGNEPESSIEFGGDDADKYVVILATFDPETGVQDSVITEGHYPVFATEYDGELNTNQFVQLNGNNQAYVDLSNVKNEINKTNSNIEQASKALTAKTEALDDRIASLQTSMSGDTSNLQGDIAELKSNLLGTETSYTNYVDTFEAALTGE